ncbi:hypothetical protein FDK38_003057 [Candidozyma auris]|nr:hypothetical protein FDK38_003057 [[Candida] auris]
MILRPSFLIFQFVSAALSYHAMNYQTAASEPMPPLSPTSVERFPDISASLSLDDSADTFEPSIPSLDKPMSLRRCASERYTIRSKADLNQILGCEDIEGNIEISLFDEAILRLDDLIYIDGSLEIKDSSALVRIELPKLQEITGEFSLYELTSLGYLQASKLNLVSKIQWRVLPILSTVDMAFEKLKKLTSILISDTSLSYIIGVSSPEMSTMNINNNRFLESLSAEVEEVTDMLHIGANGDHMNVDLPSLRRTQNLSIHNVEQLELGELKECKGSMSLDKNKFESVQLSKLTKVGGTLSLNNNMNLKNVQVDELDMVDGGLVLANNTHLHNIDFFESLSVIGGALELVGPIKEVKMPSLRLVRGSAKVKSSDEKFSCSTWAKSSISAVVRGGKNECVNSQSQNYVASTPTNPESKSTPSEKKSPR